MSEQETEILEQEPIISEGEETKKERKPRGPNKPKENPNVEPATQKQNLYIPPQKKQVYEVPKAVSRTFILNKEQFGIVHLTGTDDVVDPKTNEIRRARLIRGARSIWQDEQKNFNDDYVAKNQLSLTFYKGKCVIPIEEKLLLQFADLCNSNTENPNKIGTKKITFTEHNSTKIAEKELSDEMLVIEAMQRANNADVDDMVKHSMYLGIPLFDEVSGQSLEPGAIRTQYMLAAKRDAKKFMDSVDSAAVLNAWLVRQALDSGKIDLSRQPGQAYWTDGGHICALPKDQDATDFLIHFSQLHNDENVTFVSRLKQMVK